MIMGTPAWARGSQQEEVFVDQMLLSIAKQPSKPGSVTIQKPIKLSSEPAYRYWESVWQINGINITIRKVLRR
jgi:hypothetical protein